MYILRTHLLENPDVVFYYKGTAKEHGVPFALNTIVSFSSSYALFFENEYIANSLCEKLNAQKQTLIKVGYSEFEVISTT